MCRGSETQLQVGDRRVSSLCQILASNLFSGLNERHLTMDPLYRPALCFFLLTVEYYNPIMEICVYISILCLVIGILALIISVMVR